MRRWFAALLLALLPAAARAAEPIRASVDRTSIRADETVLLHVTISLRSNNLDQPDASAPDLGDWRVVGRSERTMFDGMSGQNTTIVDLRLQPAHAGTLKIGAFTLSSGGQQYRTKPITVEVHAGGAPSPAPDAPPDQPQAANTPDHAPANDAFVAWDVERSQVWLGEQFSATLYIYVNSELGAGQITLGDVNLEGFWSQQHDRRSGLSRGELVQVGDRIFRRQELTRFTLFPLRSGALQLPAAKVGMVLSEQFFMGRGRTQQVDRTAQPLSVEVKALPPDGRPADFAGPAVGEVKLEAQADRTVVQGDEPVQLTVTTSVDGLLQNVPHLQLPTLPDFRAFPPTENEQPDQSGDRVAGVRRETWLLRPLRGGRLTIPALRLPYFDPAAGAYREATTEPIEVTVQGQPRAVAENTPGAGPASSAAGAPSSAAAKGPALRTIRRVESLRAEPGPAYRSPLFAMAVVAPPLLLLGLVAGERVRARRADGAAGRASKRSGAEARRVLEGLRSAEPTAESFSAIARALLTFLEVRFGEPFRGLTHDQLGRRLRELGVEPAAIAELVVELENCDFARFAPASTRSGELGEAVKRAVALVGRIDGSAR